jgi:myo-inositol-1(or 4)-monophosphatase
MGLFEMDILAPTMEKNDRSKLLPELHAIMAEVGAFQLSEWRRHEPGWGEAKSAKDFVSFVDRESERMLAAVLKRSLPEAGFYGEETEKRMGATLTWVVDPLDGTTNYLSGLDLFSISVALFEAGEPVLGIVHRPAASEWWWATEGGGAFYAKSSSADILVDGRATRLPLASPCPLALSLVGTGTPFRSPDTKEAFFQATSGVLTVARDVRRLGSAALDLAFLASGWLQAFWEVDLEPYDIGASLLLLKETGCECSSFSGAPYKAFQNRSFVAGLPGAASELRAIVAPAYGSQRE